MLHSLLLLLLLVSYKMSEYTELDILYSPSRWQKRFNIDEIIEKHVGFLDERNFLLIF